MKIYLIQITWISQAPLGYRYFQIGCIFVEYDLFNITNLKQNLTYIGFGIIFRQFYINFSRQEHQIELLYVSINSRDSQVSAYTPFHFSFTIPSSHFYYFQPFINGFCILCIWRYFHEIGMKNQNLTDFFWYEI